MPRRPRKAMGGLVYHVLNRAVGRTTIFAKDPDYEVFERVLEEAHDRFGTRVLSYCVMPNHWHLVLWPRRDDELSEFMRWLTVTHTQRRHAIRGTAGSGPVYQGRFKSFPVQNDDHLLRVCRYVERNALRAGLVRRAENWRWCSLWRRRQAKTGEGEKAGSELLLSPDRWPVPPPRNWVVTVNAAEKAEELAALRKSAQRGTPYGQPNWQERTASRLGLESSLRPRGRPRLSK